MSETSGTTPGTPPQRQRTVAITGANGYVGGVLREAFAAAGWHTVSLQRSAPRDPREDLIGYSLESGPTQPLPDGLDALVHCAYDLRARSAADVQRANLGGLQTLLAAADADGFAGRLIHISSMSAYEGTEQLYGRTKLACEQVVSDRGGTSLRLGLVHGTVGTAPDGGMVATLARVARLPVVPVLRPDSHQFTVHAADAARCVLDAADVAPPETVLGVANPDPVAFSAIMQALARRTGRRRVRTVGVPAALIGTALRTLEAVGLRPGFRADSLLGLTAPAPFVTNVGYWGERGIALTGFGRAA